MNENLIMTLLAIRALLPLNERNCDRICDTIASTESLRFARTTLALARLYDRHDSFHAAHIRDTIRDNIDFPQL